MRNRMTWQNRRAAEAPAMPVMEGAHPAAQPDPAMDSAAKGDPSAWAEDVVPAPYGDVPAPNMPTDYVGSESRASGKQAALYGKANKCLKLATVMLGKTASEQARVELATSFMNLPESRLAENLNRMAGGFMVADEFDGDFDADDFQDPDMGGDVDLDDDFPLVDDIEIEDDLDMDMDPEMDVEMDDEDFEADAMLAEMLRTQDSTAELEALASENEMLRKQARKLQAAYDHTRSLLAKKVAEEVAEDDAAKVEEAAKAEKKAKIAAVKAQAAQMLKWAAEAEGEAGEKAEDKAEEKEEVKAEDKVEEKAADKKAAFDSVRQLFAQDAEEDEADVDADKTAGEDEDEVESDEVEDEADEDSSDKAASTAENTIRFGGEDEEDQDPLADDSEGLTAEEEKELFGKASKKASVIKRSPLRTLGNVRVASTVKTDAQLEGMWDTLPDVSKFFK